MRTSFFRAVLCGWMTILLALLIASAFLALIIRFSKVGETALATMGLIVAIIALFLGGLFAGIKGGARGIVLGILTGGGFTLLTFLIQYLGYDELFSFKQLLFHFAYIVSAIIGSILGVNIVQEKHTG